jgi:YidC/Oxa1 family membrane protein insertase
MEQARLLIAIVLSALIFLLWQFFFVDHDADRQTAKKTEQPPVKEEQVKESKSYPKEQDVAAADKTPSTEADDSILASVPRSITVDTSFYQAQLSERGGGISSFILKKYRKNVAKDSSLQELIPQKNSIESVLLGFAGKSLPGLDNAVFSANLSTDTVNIQDAAQKITFSWKSDEGVVVEKIYTFSPDSYLIGLDVTIKNGSDRSIQDKLFIALKGATPADTRMYGFEGPSALINEKLEEIDIKDIAEKNTYTGNLNWIAIQDRYFMMSVIPDQVEDGASMRLFLKGDDLLEAQYVGLADDIRPGTQHTYIYALFWR